MKHTMQAELLPMATAPRTREELAETIQREQRERNERATQTVSHYRILSRETGKIFLAGPRGNYELDYRKKRCTCDDARWCSRRNAQAEACCLAERVHCKHWRIARLLARAQGREDSPAQRIQRMNAEADAKQDTWGNQTLSAFEIAVVASVKEEPEGYSLEEQRDQADEARQQDAAMVSMYSHTVREQERRANEARYLKLLAEEERERWAYHDQMFMYAGDH